MPDVTPEVTWKHLEFPGGLCTSLHFTLLETLPYPIVSILKIKNDILYTLSSEMDPYWTIDSMYTTTPGPWKRPNSDVLGYHPADISGPQLDTLLSASFPLSESERTARLPRLKQVRVTALQMVADALSRTFTDSSPLSVPNNSRGSLLQLSFCELVQVSEDPDVISPFRLERTAFLDFHFICFLKPIYSVTASKERRGHINVALVIIGTLLSPLHLISMKMRRFERSDFFVVSFLHTLISLG